MNDDELKAVAKAADFKAIKELAIKDPGFAGRLKAAKSVEIDKLTIGAFIESTNTYSAETSSAIEEAFKEGFRMSEDFDQHRDEIERHSQKDPYFQPIWSGKDAMFASFMVGYQKCIQVNALLMEINVRLADALIVAYGGGSLTADEQKALGAAARKAREIADLLEGLDKLNKRDKAIKNNEEG